MIAADSTNRNYCVEMATVIDQHTGKGPYTPRIAAAEIVAKLTQSDPELLDGWLHAQAVHFVWQAINDRDRSVRAATKARAGRDDFQEANAAYERGEATLLRRFLDMPFTVEDGARKRLEIMDRTDLTFAAGDYRKRAAENTMMDLFLTSLAKKVGSGTVGDYYSEEQLARMFHSLSR